MLKRLFNKCLVHPGDVPPSREDFEVIGAFNPGAAELGEEVVLMVRVAERPREKREGFTALPRYAPGGEPVVDRVSDDELEEVDPRVMRNKVDGLVRLTFLSHLRVVRCGDGKSVESISGPLFIPEGELEEFGVEDARITPIGERFYITYVAVSRHGASTALASTRDFDSFERHGVMFPTENKDVLLFPERIGEDYYALHRPNGATPFTRPSMWISRSPDLMHWGVHRFFYGGSLDWEGGRVGGGTPPIRTEEGWLEIYHGNRKARRPGEVGVYSAGAMLLDLEEPGRILARTSEPIFAPEADFEREGFVPGVVFPTGVVERDETLLVYYGAADTCTGIIEWSREELLASCQSSVVS